jgi:hypothetical protein
MSTFTVTGTSTVTLTKPDSNGHDSSVNMGIAIFDFWSEHRATDYEGLESRPLSLASSEVVDANVWAKFRAMFEMSDNHETVTITGFGDCVDGVYVMSNFRMNSVRGTPYEIAWSVNLELVRRL